MIISVNNQKITLAAPVNLQELLNHLNQENKGIALAVNQQIVSRSQWQTHTLNEGDQITLIKATAGG